MNTLAIPHHLRIFARHFRYRFVVDTRKVALYQDLRQGIHPQGLEQYLPLFFEQTESLLDYLPANPLVVIQQGVEEAADDFWSSMTERWEQRRHDVERPVLDPTELYFEAGGLHQQLDSYDTVNLLDTVKPGNRQSFLIRQWPRTCTSMTGARSLRRHCSSSPGSFPVVSCLPPTPRDGAKYCQKH